MTTDHVAAGVVRGTNSTASASDDGVRIGDFRRGLLRPYPARTPSDGHAKQMSRRPGLLTDAGAAGAALGVRDSFELIDIVLGARPRLARNRGGRIFDGLSVHVAPGEMVALAGPPGFGGTTLARLVAGLIHPESGTVNINGVDVTPVPAARRTVGLIPVGGGLLPYLSSADNITYGLRLRKEPEAMIRHRLAAVAERLELLPSLALRPHELSPGQRIRTALARAAVRSVHVLVVDATAGAEGIGQLRHLVERAWPTESKSVLVCTHDPAVINTADRVVVVERGRAAANGRPEQLQAAPPNLAVARVLNPAPLAELTGVVRDGEVGCGPLHVPAPRGAPEGRRVVVTVPADALHLGPIDGGLPARVVTVDTSESVARVLVEPTAWPGTVWTVKLGGVNLPRVGELTGVRVVAERLLVFDGEAGGTPLLEPRANGLPT
jgi:ABC-type sugar transport system ATPase subunit